MSAQQTPRIPFAAINRAALRIAPQLLAEWFPAGKLRGKEFKVGDLSGARGDSLCINIETGEWCDFARPSHRGKDFISLRAAKYHGGDQGDAARELGERLGVYTRPHKPNGAAATNGHAKWLPIIPPPHDAPDPPLGRFDTVHTYHDRLGCPTHYVRRLEARRGGRKQFLPLTFGTLDGQLGWHMHHPDAPRPLYNLHLLARRPDAPVIICEGEKASDAAAFLFPDYVCVTWPAGSGAVDATDFSPLKGRKVIIWPDNDSPGLKAAAQIAAKLPAARIMAVSDLAAGADAADVQPDHPEQWLQERLPPDPAAALRSMLSIEAWAERDIPEPDFLLGSLITTTSRAFLVGRTGLGKTMLGLAIAVGVASGRGFLHWRSSRAARVLYVDGEMPGELIKARAIDALRRAGSPPPPGNLIIFGRDIEEEVAVAFPTLGTLAPLNTEGGQNFIHGLIGLLGGVDLVVFDNVMSLVAGDQKDEVPWSDTMPLIQALTGKRVGQLWLDHTGHNSDRQYGSATKAWRFDAVGNMAALPDGERDPRHLAFRLSFDAPGKARRRTPDNWREFAPCTIRLCDDRWTSELEEQTGPRRKLSPMAEQFYRALMDALAISSAPGQTTRSLWYAECVRTGLADAIVPEEGWKAKGDKQTKFRKYLMEMKAAGLIGVDGEAVCDLRVPPRQLDLAPVP